MIDTTEWLKAKQKNSLYAYIEFLKLYPNSIYHDEAVRNIESLKVDLLRDLVLRPYYSSRSEISYYINNNLLSYDELVNKYHLLTDRSYNQIVKYPNISYEIGEIGDIPSYSDNPISRPRNIDVLPIGRCGSGGKTFLLAAIMTLTNSQDFILTHDFVNNNYAYYLTEQAKSHRILPGTDVACIQVMDTELLCNHVWKGVSFIEFSGERVHQIAGNNLNEGFSYEGTGLNNIIKNDNRKILLFAIDPTNNQELRIGWDGDTWVFQDDLIDCLAHLLKYDKLFSKKILSIHIVVTKKDLWKQNANDENAIREFLIGLGYGAALSTLEDVCKKYGIMSHNNYRPDIIPFSIGRFTIGQTYEFDNTDARKLLNIIRNDISRYPTHLSFQDKFKHFFNS